MSPVARFELVLLLLAIIIVLELAARRLRLPPAAAFVLGGIALALIPETPQAELDPDLALVLFLPPLLLSSAFFTVWRDFRANLRIILQLAVGAVAFTTLIVGLVAHLVRRIFSYPKYRRSTAAPLHVQRRALTSFLPMVAAFGALIVSPSLFCSWSIWSLSGCIRPLNEVDTAGLSHTEFSVDCCLQSWPALSC